VAVFAARFVVQDWLYGAGFTGWLAFARIAMGYPLVALAFLIGRSVARVAGSRSCQTNAAKSRKLHMSVSTKPGRIVLTRMGANSSASDRDNASTAARAEVAAAKPCFGRTAVPHDPMSGAEVGG
jgi:hypothetical protein